MGIKFITRLPKKEWGHFAMMVVQVLLLEEEHVLGMEEWQNGFMKVLKERLEEQENTYQLKKG
jgi:hypothetical protein